MNGLLISCCTCADKTFSHHHMTSVALLIRFMQTCCATIFKRAPWNIIYSNKYSGFHFSFFFCCTRSIGHLYKRMNESNSLQVSKAIFRDLLQMGKGLIIHRSFSGYGGSCRKNTAGQTIIQNWAHVWNLQRGIVAQQVVLPPHSFRVLGLILTLGYCSLAVLLVLTVFTWTPLWVLRFPPKNMQVFTYKFPLNVNESIILCCSCLVFHEFSLHVPTVAFSSGYNCWSECLPDSSNHSAVTHT